MIIKWNEYQKVNENLQKARSILNKAGIKENNEDFQKLKKLLDRNVGYLGKFTEWLINNKISYERLENLYKEIKGKNLSKPIDEFKTPEEIIDTLIRNNADTVVNQIIQSIPSNARNFLRHGNCYECDNTRLIACDECDGDSANTCIRCGGTGKENCTCNDGRNTCDKCKGRGTYYRKECDKCKGTGNLKCECGGSGEITCRKCNGKVIDCKTCKNTGEIKCTECKKESDEWKNFVNFLKLQVEHKDLIIDFFSKKGGRYSSDEYYDGYDYDGPLDELTTTLTRLINIPSIDTIINNLPNEENLKLIHNDDNILIVACNYEGIEKYGSSYWCIHQDESTFNEYVYSDDLRQQWIMYIKGKTPMVDDKSVMGITYGVERPCIEYAYWEDDDESVDDGIKILKKIKLDKKLIADAFVLYDYEDNSNVILRNIKYLKSNLEKVFIETKKSLEKKEKSKNYRQKNDYTVLIDIITEYLECYDWTTELTMVFKELCNKYEIKIPVITDNLEVLIVTDLYKYSNFVPSKYKDDIFDILCNADQNDDTTIEVISWLISNGYDIKKHLKSYYAKDFLIPLFKLKIVSLVDLIKGGVDLDNCTELHNDITINLLNNLSVYVRELSYNQNLFSLLFDNLSDDNNLLLKYKSDILKFIALLTERSKLEYILDSIDDDDIEMACARKLLHRKIISKYDVEMKKKMLEKLVSFKNFKK